MKGVLLAGGTGSRLFPLTRVLSKQLLPVYDKPLVYYPLSVLMLTGLKEILVISTEQDLPLLEGLLGDGSQLGISIHYKVQPSPDGLAQAFILAENFLAGDSACLVLGDNIFYGQGIGGLLKNAMTLTDKQQGACVFGYYVNDPSRYGVVEFDQNNQVLSLEEKPARPRSNYAVTGLYFYDNNVVNYAKQVKPSKRGELEITDLNKLYLEKNLLNVQLFGRGFAWLDAGTHDSMLEASQFIAAVEKRQGLKIGCIEEIAWRMGYINREQLLALASASQKSGYGLYLENLVKRNNVSI